MASNGPLLGVQLIPFEESGRGIGNAFGVHARNHLG